MKVSKRKMLFFQKKVFSDKNRYLCAQGKQLLYYESYRRRLVFA